MIKSCKDKEAARLFNRQLSRKLPSEIQRIGWRKLGLLNQAKTLDDLSIPPGNHLEALKGDRLGQYSIRSNGRWRICLVWGQGDDYEVELVVDH